MQSFSYGSSPDLQSELVLFRGDYQAGLALLDDGAADLIVMDPPYGTTALPWDKAPDLAALWGHLDRILKPTGIVVSFAAQPFTTALICSNRQDFRYCLVWEKTVAVGYLDANLRPLRAHEDIVVFCRRYRGARNRKLSTYNPQMEPGKPYHHVARDRRRECAHYRAHLQLEKLNHGTRYPRSVLRFSNRSGKSLHPTQKPVDLVEWLIRTYSNPGELVVDPFAGSGTTILAAARTGRRAFGCELQEVYCEVAAGRVREALSQCHAYTKTAGADSGRFRTNGVG